MRASVLPLIMALGASGVVLPLNPAVSSSGTSPSAFTADKSVYDVLSSIDNAGKFKSYINKSPLGVRLMNHDVKSTVFVPTDDALAKFPDLFLGALKEPDVGSVDFLRYHIVPADVSWPSMMSLHTLPSLLEEEDLGGHPQRLRIDAGVVNTEVNFYAKVLKSYTSAVNGVVHVIDHVLVEPPREGKLLEHLPGDYSTSCLALEKTRLDRWLHRQDAEGSTVFIPTNKAWSDVKDDVRNWLFSDEGKDYLRVILEGHVVFDRTLYSDNLYLGDAAKESREKEDFETQQDRLELRDRKPRPFEDFLNGHVKECREGPIPNDDSDGTKTIAGSQCHITFPTVLEKAQLDVEISRVLGKVTIRLNDRINVELADAIARDGVIHVIEDVLVPVPEAGRHTGQKDKAKLLKEMELREVERYLKSWVQRDSRFVGGHNHWMDDKTLKVSGSKLGSVVDEMRKGEEVLVKDVQEIVETRTE